MNKNDFALTPPMGWNSYDYYDTTVTEEQVKANADYMAKHLKQYGWEYIVVDIEWYANDAGTKRDQYQLHLLLGIWRWINGRGCSQVLSVFLRLRMEADLLRLRHMCTALG